MKETIHINQEFCRIRKGDFHSNKDNKEPLTTAKGRCPRIGLIFCWSTQRPVVQSNHIPRSALPL